MHACVCVGVGGWAGGWVGVNSEAIGTHHAQVCIHAPSQTLLLLATVAPNPNLPAAPVSTHAATRASPGDTTCRAGIHQSRPS